MECGGTSWNWRLVEPARTRQVNVHISEITKLKQSMQKVGGLMLKKLFGDRLTEMLLLFINTGYLKFNILFATALIRLVMTFLHHPSG